MVKKGPLTRDELMQVWASAVDSTYSEPLEAAGEGNGLEVHSQAAEQLARVSRAVDETTQGFYILPHSSQTAAPASGGRKATVALSFMRSKRVELPLVLAPGFIVEEETTDFGENGPVTVTTGRRYITTEAVVFMPGEVGPITVQAEAEKPGWGYNNPLPSTISRIVQIGADFERDRATVTAPNLATGSVSLPAKGLIQTVNEADTFVPEHVGQYVTFWGGANGGLVARIVGFDPPDPTLPRGSNVRFDVIHAYAGVLTGTFEVGESVDIDSGAGTGIVLGARGTGQLVIQLTVGAPAANASVITGAGSGATLTVNFLAFTPSYTSEAPSGGIGGASWRVLSWAESLGVEVSNEESPSGGVAALLDEIGSERGLDRAPGEDDETYRRRLAALADVVTPNAIKRALSRTLGAIAWSFREVGSDDLPGFFFDGTLEVPSGTAGRARNDAFDTDVLVYTGTLDSGTFHFQEPVIVTDDGGAFGARGYVGSLTGGDTILTLIRRDGTAIAGGTYRVRGLYSGAIFTTTAVAVPTTVAARRYHRWLDYEQFRAYFVVEVERLGIDEFGFAYDVGSANAYDVGALDGYPYGNAAIYKRAYQAVDEARAGGVGFHFEPMPE